jgi:hypothetical protein
LDQNAQLSGKTVVPKVVSPEPTCGIIYQCVAGANSSVW